MLNGSFGTVEKTIPAYQTGSLDSPKRPFRIAEGEMTVCEMDKVLVHNVLNAVFMRMVRIRTKETFAISEPFF